MSPEELKSLLIATLTIIGTVILIIVLKRLAKIPIGSIGLDCNLLTYGYLWDTIMDAMRGDYWTHFPKQYEQFKPIILACIIILNLILLLENMRLSHNLEIKKLQKHKYPYHLLNYILGFLSLGIFITFKTLCD